MNALMALPRALRFGTLMLLAISPSAMTPQDSHPQPLTLPLDCDGGDCLLLKGAPQTAGLRSGYVRLMPGELVGWHSTGAHEEALVILHGRGEVKFKAAPSRPISSNMLAYIPPNLDHNVQNTGDDMLEYVYVVALAAAPPHIVPAAAQP